MSGRILQKIAVALILLSFVSEISAQNSIGFNIGIGTYDMSDLKSILKRSVQDNPLDPVLVSDFPPFFYYQPTFRFEGKNWNTGLNFSVFSSGSRWSIRDYTGEYRLDALVKSYAPAFFAERSIYKKDKFTCYLHCDAGFLVSTVDIKEFFNVLDNQYINSTMTASSLNVFIAPQLNVKYPLINKVTLEGFAGFQVDLVRGPIMQSPKLGEYLEYLFEKAPDTNWSGLRIGIGVSYLL